MSLIEKIASIVEGALIRHGVTEFEGTLDDAQAALTAIMGEGDGVQEVANGGIACEKCGHVIVKSD